MKNSDLESKIHIIEETDEYIVAYKPAGLSVQSKRLTEKTLETAIRADNRHIKYLSAVNRLDQPVEGLVLLAKNPASAAKLTKQISEHSVTKEYLAVVEGMPQQREGILEDYLLRDGATNTSSVVEDGTKGAKKARLSYICEKRAGNLSLLRISLYTGRHHQIRVQLANAGMPILGDRKYNRSNNNDTAFPALCACCLEFTDPKGKKKMHYEAEPMGKAFREIQTYGEMAK